MQASGSAGIRRREVGGNVWLGRSGAAPSSQLVHRIHPEVIETEQRVGRLMFEEIEAASLGKQGDLAIVLLGGRGAQAMHRQLGEISRGGARDDLLGRLHVFTQDALAPLDLQSPYSFVRDFERLLGADFFNKVKSFTPMRTDADDLEGELVRVIEAIEPIGA